MSTTSAKAAKPGKKSRRATQPQVYKALAHPLRMKLLAAMSEREASPSELAIELEEPLGNVSYHVRMLQELGCIELVRTTPRRGALEHHYRAIVRPLLDDADWGRVPQSARRSISAGRLSEIWESLTESLSAGTFDDRADRHLSWTNLSLDEEGWAEVNELLIGLVDRALEIQAESAGRLEGKDASEIRSSKLVLIHYEPGVTAAKKVRKGKAKGKAKA